MPRDEASTAEEKAAAAVAEEKAARDRLAAARDRAILRYGERVHVIECGGRVWCVAVPRENFRRHWQIFKASRESPDPTTKADAAVQLARSMLVPLEGDDVKAEKVAFDAMGELYPSLLDLLGETAEVLAQGPLPLRVATPPDSSAPGDATPTSPPTP